MKAHPVTVTRKCGAARDPSSLSSQLRDAPEGAEVWTSHSDKTVTSALVHVKRLASTTRFLAIHPKTREVIPLCRVTLRGPRAIPTANVKTIEAALTY